MSVAAGDVLDQVASVGEFFALERAPTGPEWVRLGVLTTDPAVLEQRVARLRDALAVSARCDRAAVPVRTAASMDLQALAARVLSPAIGGCALAGLCPTFTLDALCWQPGRPHLALTATTLRSASSTSLAAEALRSGVLEPVLVPLVGAYAAQFRLSLRVLWGNVASAAGGSTAVLEAGRLPTVHPPQALVADLCSADVLRPTVRATRPRFLRNSCCLYYRVPRADMCGDCVLTRRRSA